MFHNLKKRKINEVNLYNSILFLSRNKLLYTQIGLKDTFQNKINLVFIHISFIFTKINQKNKILDYKKFYQKMFDLIFENIELNRNLTSQRTNGFISAITKIRSQIFNGNR